MGTIGVGSVAAALFHEAAVPGCCSVMTPLVAHSAHCLLVQAALRSTSSARPLTQRSTLICPRRWACVRAKHRTACVHDSPYIEVIDDPGPMCQVLWRQKEQFSDGVGYNWIDGLKEHAENIVSDEQLRQALNR